ncbi:hypothetical protein [Enterobacter roggenkampii]|uniref:hypothetical protein n=1 Tax=Enterobacter roggenkampii TaxID=1812935 RepID=UPI0035234C5C
MSNKYEDLIKNARMNADCGEHMSPTEVTTLLNVVETTFAALAAESARLKGALNKISFTYPLSPHIHGMTTIQTPDTDAYLAEVRAQGVESAINMVVAMMNHQHPVAEKVIDILNTHAAQLRKGVQS